jgi:hypothetical protein
MSPEYEQLIEDIARYEKYRKIIVSILITIFLYVVLLKLGKYI